MTTETETVADVLAEIRAITNVSAAFPALSMDDLEMDDFATRIQAAHAREVGELHKSFGYELRDPNGTIWEHAASLQRDLVQAAKDSARIDYMERTFRGMTNGERYLTVTMGWGKSHMGRTLREACDKYMNRDAAMSPRVEVIK